MKFAAPVYLLFFGSILCLSFQPSLVSAEDTQADYYKGNVVFNRTLKEGLSSFSLDETDKTTIQSHEKKLPGLYDHLMNYYVLIAEMRNPKLKNAPDRFVKTAKLMAQEFLASVAESRPWDTYSPLHSVLMSAGYYAEKDTPMIRYYFRDFKHLLGKGWAISELQIPKAHSLSKGKTVKVAIVDSGIDPTWKRIKPRIVRWKNFLDGSKPFMNNNHYPYDRGGHGTSIASVIYQISPQADLIIIKVHDGDTMLNVPPSRWTVYLVTAGIFWAVQNGADVINLSMAFLTDLDPIHKASMMCWKNNVILVSPVANRIKPFNKDYPSFPAAYPWTIAVGGIDRHKGSLRLWPYSGRGNYVDVVAPARGIWNAMPTYLYRKPRYSVGSGNSLANAIVSGAAALMLTAMGPEKRESLKKKPGELFNTVQQILRKTASNRELGENRYNPRSGYGIVDIPAAVASAKNLSFFQQENRKKSERGAYYFSFVPMRW